jgi:hypothetical protein
VPVCRRTVSEGLGTSTRSEFGRRVKRSASHAAGRPPAAARLVGLEVDAGDRTTSASVAPQAASASAMAWAIVGGRRAAVAAQAEGDLHAAALRQGAVRERNSHAKPGR